MKYTLTCEDNVTNNWKIASEFEADFIDDVIDNFELFLRGCGFSPNVKVTIQDNDDTLQKVIDEMYDEVDREVSNNVMGFTVDSLSMWDSDSKKLESDNCTICGFSLAIADRHECFENLCPVKNANKR